MTPPDWATERRKLRVAGRTTTVLLEVGIWRSYDTVVGATGLGPHALASRIDARRGPGISLTGLIRLFLLTYWHAVAEGATPYAALDTAFTAITPDADDADARRLLGLKDRIAPVLTPARVGEVQAQLARDTDPAAVGSAMRDAWGTRAPWTAAEDWTAGMALLALVRPAD